MQLEAHRNDPLVQQMQAAAEAAYPQEACGLIVGVGKKAHFLPCKNISSQPTEAFQIDPADYARAEDMGEVLAIWHSHPEAGPQPSESDLAGCEMTQLPWFITAIAKHEGVFYHDGPSKTEPSGFQMPYLERPYVFGIFDCYSLLVDYYQREFGIELEHLADLRVEKWWKTGQDFMGEHYAKQGFQPVTDDSWQDGDVLLFALDSTIPNHVAIYVTGDIILHHMPNRLSRRETCGSFWRSRLTHHLRHQSKC